MSESSARSIIIAPKTAIVLPLKDLFHIEQWFLGLLILICIRENIFTNNTGKSSLYFFDSFKDFAA